MAGKGGGAWKVAYADFVTAMMAFFMVMWLTSQKPEVKASVAGYFRDPYALYKGAETGHAADATPAVDPKLGHDASSQPRRISNSGDDTNYQFAVLFADDSAVVDPAASEAIRTFAPTMVGKLNRIEVRAHCQRHPLPEGSEFKDLLDLCYARGRAVQAALEAQGVESNRIRTSQAGPNEPIAENLTDEELKLNSRVDVIMLSDVVDTPWHAPKTDEVETPAPEPEPDAPFARLHEDDAEPGDHAGGAANANPAADHAESDDAHSGH